MKVTLYAIAKNEEKNIEKFLLNAKKFDDVVVVDTGSTDNTVQLLKDAGIKVYEHPQTRAEFDFSVARNQALSYVETDWAFALDFNEDVDEFHPEGFGVIAGEFTTFNHLRFDDNGTGEPVQSNEVHTRLHRTKNYTWVNAVHEVPNFIPTEEYPNASGVDTTIKITKKIHKSIDKELFYFSICEREHKKDPSNWYWIWFIFNHYFNVQNTEKALEYGQEFLNVSKPYFDSFRVLVFIRCSNILISSGDIQKGANYAFHALSEGMNFGGEILGNAFMHLFMVGKLLNNPNIVVFASAFSEYTLNADERKQSIKLLYDQLQYETQDS
jgi:glycosyltransferase involved in cell wall biosynthesis